MLRDQTVVQYEDLVRHICDQFKSSNSVYGRRYKDHIQVAVKREIRARRIALDALHPGRLVITPIGLRFYREWGSIPLYDRKDARMRYLTIRQLNMHACALRDILKEISNDIAVYYHDNDNMHDHSTLPNDVYTVCNNVKRLQDQNTELEVELNLQEGRKQRLLTIVGF
ncbi:hypothetical protein C2E23DRAFT_883091 [Lenzites betulinus]|nr:hypothetical protein C2E23DRAFT_883091 [Lenzites betulinus]